jgi:hypothetical protein
VADGAHFLLSGVFFATAATATATREKVRWFLDIVGGAPDDEEGEDEEDSVYDDADAERASADAVPVAGFGTFLLSRGSLVVLGFLVALVFRWRGREGRGAHGRQSDGFPVKTD